jgi:hypothetical protein
MLRDTTCVSYEIPSTRELCGAFVRHWQRRAGDFRLYTLRPADMAAQFNCVAAALTILKEFLRSHSADFDDGYLEQLRRVTSPAQGKLMRLLMGGFC